MSPVLEASAAVRARLRGSIENVARAAGISEELVGKHLDPLVAKALTRLKDHYVNEMGHAVERVGDLRKVVHDYYKKAFRKKLAAGELADLRQALDNLRDVTRELVSPDEWARRRLGRPLGELVPEPFARVRGERPPVEVPVATVAPSWATGGLRLRFEALPAAARLALERAGKFLERSTVEDALAAKPGAVTRMYQDLRDVVSPAELREALDAVAMVQHPDAGYALGGGLGGSRPPADQVRAAYDALPPAERIAFDRAAAADPDRVRAGVTAETSGGFGAVPDPDLQRAMTRLNLGHQASRGAVERGIGSSQDAQSRGAQLREQVSVLGLPPEGRIAEELRGSALLRDLGTRNPDKLLDLAAGWLDKVDRDTRSGEPLVSLETYVRKIMTTNERGMVGEFGAVFQLGSLVDAKPGEGVLVLKAPGTDVNVNGSDLIVVVPGVDEIWIGDNKTLSEAGLGEVTSLVERFPPNLSTDVTQLGKSLAGLPAEAPGVTRIRDAMARLAEADTRVQKLLGDIARERGLPRKAIDEMVHEKDIQQRITAVLDQPDIRARRVILNSGGELAYLRQRLTERNIDLADLRKQPGPLLDEMAKKRRTPPGGGTP